MSFVKGVSGIEKLAELARGLGLRLEIDVESSRCPKCNGETTRVSGEEVLNRIPEWTSRFYDDFWVCDECGQIYWQGSHWRRIINTVKEARKMAERSSYLQQDS